MGLGSVFSYIRIHRHVRRCEKTLDVLQQDYRLEVPRHSVLWKLISEVVVLDKELDKTATPRSIVLMDRSQLCGVAEIAMPGPQRNKEGLLTAVTSHPAQPAMHLCRPTSSRTTWPFQVRSSGQTAPPRGSPPGRQFAFQDFPCRASNAAMRRFSSSVSTNLPSAPIAPSKAAP